MWRWLLVPLVLLPIYSMGAPTSLGPTSESEAELLWTEGQKSFQNSQYQDTINYLERLLNRYPGKPGYLKAQLLYGASLLEMDRPQDAIRPLADFISANGTHLDAVQARISLGQAYLKLKKFNEALLSALEIEKMRARIEIPTEETLKTIWIKAQSLLSLKHEDQAIQAIDSTESLTNTNSKAYEKITPRTLGRILALQIDLKTRTCSHLAPSQALEEGHLRNLLDREGSCLLEALLVFQKLLKMGDGNSVDQATQTLADAYELYAKSSSNPPPAPTAVSRKQSRQQAAQYHKELADLLTQDFRKKTTAAKELLESWKPDVSPLFKYSVDRILESLEKTRNKARS